LQQDENTLLEVVADTDSICTPCPHRRDLSCEFQQKILTLDNAHKEALELEYGAVLSWSEAKHRIKQQMSLEQFHKACESCSWKEWGVCEEALRGLLQSTGSLDTKKNKL